MPTFLAQSRQVSRKLGSGPLKVKTCSHGCVSPYTVKPGVAPGKRQTHHYTACDLSPTRHCMIACPTYAQSVPSELSTPTASLAHPSHPCTAYTIISCFKHVASHLYLVEISYILISTYINMYQPIPSINGCDIWVSSEASNKSFGAGEDFAHALVAHRNGIRIRTALAGDETAGRVEQSGRTGTKWNKQQHPIVEMINTSNIVQYSVWEFWWTFNIHLKKWLAWTVGWVRKDMPMPRTVGTCPKLPVPHGLQIAVRQGQKQLLEINQLTRFVWKYGTNSLVLYRIPNEMGIESGGFIQIIQDYPGYRRCSDPSGQHWSNPSSGGLLGPPGRPSLL